MKVTSTISLTADQILHIVVTALKLPENTKGDMILGTTYESYDDTSYKVFNNMTLTYEADLG